MIIIIIDIIIVSSPNDLLCVEWDVKPYTLTHSLIIIVEFLVRLLLQTRP